jgi:DNA repair exonuclease SbcCD ATPase subunit
MGNCFAGVAAGTKPVVNEKTGLKQVEKVEHIAATEVAAIEKQETTVAEKAAALKKKAEEEAEAAKKKAAAEQQRIADEAKAAEEKFEAAKKKAAEEAEAAKKNAEAAAKAEQDRIAAAEKSAEEKLAKEAAELKKAEEEAKATVSDLVKVNDFIEGSGLELSWSYADTNPVAYHNPARWSNKMSWDDAIQDILGQNAGFARPLNIIEYTDGKKTKEYKVTSVEELQTKHDELPAGTTHYQFGDFTRGLVQSLHKK